MIQEHLDYLIERTVRNGSLGRETLLPPIQIGERRIEAPTTFKLLKQESLGDQNKFVLTWLNTNSKAIKAYNILGRVSRQNATGYNSPEFTQIGSVKTPPAEVYWPKDAETRITLIVQPELENGQKLDPKFCPAITVISL